MKKFLLFLIIPFMASSQVTAPELIIPSSEISWEQQRRLIRQTLEELMGAVPPRPAVPEVKIIATEDKGTYTLEKFEFDNGAGAIVPGYLLIPKNKKSRHPAVYYSHWHGGNYDLGKEEIFTTHHTPQIPAVALVSAGYAVMAIDAYSFGERSGKGPGGPEEKNGAEELSISKRELWLGRSMWAMIVRDDRMAVDYLFSRPEIDPQQVAATGISMGATRTWWLMALDDRIKTGVAVGCMTRYQELNNEQKLKYHGIYYFVPGMLQHFDTETIISLAAPRPMLFMTGEEDYGSPVTGVVKIEAVVKKVYGLYGKQDQFSSILYPKTGHVYTEDMWNRMLAWMAIHLK